MIDVNALKFDENGLIPAIVVDAVSKQVLTLAYMNKESLQISLETSSQIRLPLLFECLKVLQIVCWVF